MVHRIWMRLGRTVWFVAFTAACSAVFSDEGEWKQLEGLGPWKKPSDEWLVAGDVTLDTGNAKRLTWKQGTGVLVNGRRGSARNLVSKKAMGDVEVHVEFAIPKGSNSGVKLAGVYEIQIFDSWSVKIPTASDCGGIYPRADLLPKYHKIDHGFPPMINASRPPGEWQALDIVFKAPRFNAAGEKIENARFVKVTLNGQVIHQDVEMKYPTGHAWRQKEHPTGPLLLQGDHGPVAFRNVRVRSWHASAARK